MTRFLILLALIAVAVPAQAQRVFRASSIDLEQNARLDDHESRLAALESRRAEPVAAPVAQEEPVQPAVVVRPTTVTVTAPAQPVAIQSSRYSSIELRSMIQQQRPGGWRGPVYASVEPESWARQHLIGDHGFSANQVDGLSHHERLILHDLAHGGKIRATRSGQSVQRAVAQPVYSQPVAQPVYQPAPQPVYQQRSQPVYQQSGGCPNGQCPTSPAQRSAPQRFRLFGGWR